MRLVKNKKEPELEVAHCGVCGCTMRFGFVVDPDDEFFRIVRIICQCGASEELEYDDEVG